MKGGVVARNFNSENTYADKMQTLFDFMDQCTCKILTDNSAACITYLFTRTEANKLSSPSPYISCRSNSMGEDVNSILLKVFIAANESTDKDGNPFFIKKLRSDRYIYEYDDPNKNIPRSHPTTLEELQKEVKIQDYTYKKSFIAPITTCEPICPAIILASDHIISNDSEEHKKFLDSILKNLERRIQHQDDQDITKEWFKYKDEKLYIFNKDTKNFEPILGEGETNQKGMMFIAMEMMEGYSNMYDTMYNLSEISDYKTLIYMCLWQFMILSHVIGIRHNDAHGDNIMFNSLNKDYFNGYSGQPLIIDFGKSEYLPERSYNKFASLDKFFDEYKIRKTNKTVDDNFINEYCEQIFNILNVHHKFIKNWCSYIMFINSGSNDLNYRDEIHTKLQCIYVNDDYSDEISILIKTLFISNLDLDFLYKLTIAREISSVKIVDDFNKLSTPEISLLDILTQQISKYIPKFKGIEDEKMYECYNITFIEGLNRLLNPKKEVKLLPVKRDRNNNNITLLPPNIKIPITSNMENELQLQKLDTTTTTTGGFKKLKSKKHRLRKINQNRNTKKHRQRKTKKVSKSKYNKN